MSTKPGEGQSGPLSLALGVDCLFVSTRAARKVDQSAVGGTDGDFLLRGDGDGWGYNLGLLYRPNRTFRLGFAYRSAIDVKIKGEANLRGIALPLQPLFGGDSFSTAASTRMKFPEIYSLGVGLMPAENWTIAFDLELVRWSSFSDATTDFSTEVPAAGIVDTSVPLQWKDSLQAKVGFEYRRDRQVYRCGYAYIPSFVPDQTLSPDNPDADSHNLHLGGGYVGKRWQVDLAYILGLYRKRTLASGPLAGEFYNRTHLLALSFGWKF